MLRASLMAGCFAVVAAACTPAQAPAMRTSGKIMAIGGVAGIVGSALAMRATHNAADMLLGCELISAIGVVTYAYAELTFPHVTHRLETVSERNHRWAKILTERSSGAAREGRCDYVRRSERRVHKYDGELHDLVFMRDAEILRCLTAPPDGETPKPDGAAPVTPPEPPPEPSPSP
jgi:hypothetical protein